MELGVWLSENFSVQNIKGSEYLLVCPVCNRPKLYFNISKRIGYCHYAKCDFHTQACTLKDLQSYASESFSGAFDRGVSIYGPDSGESGSQAITLPQTATPLVDLVEGVYTPRFCIASREVERRGVSVEDQYRFDIRFGSGRVTIPIFYEGKLVQWIGRAVWWLPTQNKVKYLYADGPKVGNYLFNYGEMKSRPFLTLVENTYNAIWLRDILNTTSIFGSNLTDEQTKLIVRSAAKMVYIMFDEGAEEKAEQAKYKLENSGVAARVVAIEGQPDNHSREYLKDVTIGTGN